MKRGSAVLYLALTVTAWLILPASALRGQTSDQPSAASTITFERAWDQIKPQSLIITVSANGAAKYSSSNPGKTGDDVDDYKTELTLSHSCSDKLFRYAREANYFDGDFTYKKHAVASTGKKTLSYADSTRHFSATYDYSENKPVAEITSIFLGISNTVEHGRKLAFLRRFDKLGLEAELKGMESEAQSNNLAELQLIFPTLESIVADSSILNIARQRAKRLMIRAKLE